MQQRQLRLGDTLDDYCPRERRLTNHVIVAMVGDEVKQTRCTTCDSDHEYKHARVPRQRKKSDTPAALYTQVAASAPKRVVHETAAGEAPDSIADEEIDEKIDVPSEAPIAVPARCDGAGVRTLSRGPKDSSRPPVPFPSSRFVSPEAAPIASGRDTAAEASRSISATARTAISVDRCAAAVTSSGITDENDRSSRQSTVDSRQSTGCELSDRR